MNSETAIQHILAAGADPRTVFASMGTELEKIAGFLDWGARLMGRGAIGLGESLGARGLTRGVGEGMSRWGAGVFERQAARAAEQAAAGAVKAKAMGQAAEGALSSPMRNTLTSAYAKTQNGVLESQRLAKTWGAQAQRGVQNANRFAATRAADAQASAAMRGLPSAGAGAARPAAQVPNVAEAMRGQAASAATYNSGASAAAAAHPPAAAGGVGNQLQQWGGQVKNWWNNPATPAWQRYGLVAGGAAIPGLTTGAMMGGGGQPSVVIQR